MSRVRSETALWDQQAAAIRNQLQPRFCGGGSCEIAKTLGKGELQFLVERLAGEEPDDYAQRLNMLSLKYPSVKFVAGDDDAYEDGQEKITDYAENAIASVKEMCGLTGHVGVASSGTLHQAMDFYVEWIKKDYFDIEEKHVNDNGMTKIKQVVSLKEFLPDVPLSELGYQGVDDLFGTLRRCPVSKRTGSPLKAKTCKNYLGELRRLRVADDPPAAQCSTAPPLKCRPQRIRVSPLPICLLSPSQNSIAGSGRMTHSRSFASRKMGQSKIRLHSTIVA